MTEIKMSELARVATEKVVAHQASDDMVWKNIVTTEFVFCGVHVSVYREFLTIKIKCQPFDAPDYESQAIHKQETVKIEERHSVSEVLCSHVPAIFEAALAELHRQHMANRVWRECYDEGRISHPYTSFRFRSADFTRCFEHLNKYMLADWQMRYMIAEQRASEIWRR